MTTPRPGRPALPADHPGRRSTVEALDAAARCYHYAPYQYTSNTIPGLCFTLACRRVKQPLERALENCRLILHHG